MVRRVNASGARVVSVDIPSGLEGDTGEPMGGAIRADVTVTMGLAKIGLLKEPAIDFVGKLVVGKLSYPPELIERIKTDVHLIHPDDVCPLLPRRKFSAHKGDFGHALLLAGSQGLSGAATLCATAAARSGAGLTTLMVPQKIYPFVASAVPPEIMVRPAPSTGAGTFLDTAYGHLEEAAWPSRANALGCGCGLGQHPKTRQFVEDLLLEWPHAMVLDADALNCIAVHPGLLLEATGPVILTPHPGEMARLVHKTVDSVQTDRWGVARRFARENQVIVVLKGARTVVTDGTELWINATGNPAMASGGMGDALTGIIVGLLAQGLRPFDAARTGVYLHGLAGDLALEKSGGRVLLASDLIGCLNQAFAAVE
jgi:NAD(P)H-hydrate epimerase